MSRNVFSKISSMIESVISKVILNYKRFRRERV